MSEAKNARKNEEARFIHANPFFAGRTEAAERYGYLSANAAQWRRISSALLACCAVCVLAVIYAAGRITVVPYIVQVDGHGYEIAVEPAALSRVDARLMIAHVARYVWSMKTVFNDPEAQLHLMNFVYSSTPVNTAAEKKYQEYYNANNPVISGETETVQATVASVFVAGAEILYDRDSAGINDSNKSPGDVAAESVAGSILDMSAKIMNRAADVQPTITVRPGKKMTIFVQQDVVFPFPYEL